MHDPKVFGIVVEANRLCLEHVGRDLGRGPREAEWRPLFPQILVPVICDAVASAEIDPESWLIINGDHGRPRLAEILAALADLDFIAVHDLPGEPRRIRAGERLLKRMRARLIDWREPRFSPRVATCLDEARKRLDIGQFFGAGLLYIGKPFDVIVCNAAALYWNDPEAWLLLRDEDRDDNGLQQILRRMSLVRNEIVEVARGDLENQATSGPFVAFRAGAILKGWIEAGRIVRDDIGGAPVPATKVAA